MRKKLTNFSLVIFSFGFALILAELLVRLFWPQNLVYHNDSVWKADDTVGWRHHENVNIRVNFGQQEVTFKTDEQGFRINASDNLESKVGTTNILVLGDSFMEAIQVENRNTVPQILKRQLEQAPGLNLRFYNAGVSGWDPNQYFVEGKRILTEGKLDIDHVLVFLYEANDVILREVEKFVKKDKHNTRSLRMPKSFSKREISNSLLYPLNDLLEKNSHLFVLAKSSSNKLMTRLGLSHSYFSFVYLKKHKDTSGWATTTTVCKKIKQEFGQHNIAVDFVLIPTTYHVNPEILEEYLDAFDIKPDSVDMQQPNRILSELFTRDSMHLYDPLNFFKEKTEMGHALYGAIDTHFNEAGHEALAEFLLPVLKEKLLEEKRVSD